MWRPGIWTRCRATCSIHLDSGLVQSLYVDPSGSTLGVGVPVRHHKLNGACPLWTRIPMQNSEKRRFIDDECRSDMDVVRETAEAAFACVAMRDLYAARTAGTCECAPASHVEVIHSI